MIIIHTMNDNPKYLPRLLEGALRRALRSSPVVVVTGARQTGKSTLAQHVQADRERLYMTLDDLEVLEAATSQPDSLVDRAPFMTFDEVQRSPDLLRAVKRAVDRKRTPGRFILTGSANLLLMKRVSESLAGRAVYLTLMPFTRGELRGEGLHGLWAELFSNPSRDWPELIKSSKRTKADWREHSIRGGYPVPALQLRSHDDRSLWFGGYAATYLERDLQDIATVTSLVDFRRLMRAICLRLGNIVNQTELGRDVGMSQPTVHRHLDLLEASYQLVRLSAYSVNKTKRLIKTPKGYWSDTGLAMHIAGESEPRGCHLENIVLADLLAWRGTGNGAEIHYWRATTGEEVDFVVEWKNEILPVEIKTTTKPRLSDVKHLLTFREEYKKTSLAALFLHAGDETHWLADGVLATPWWTVM